MNRDRRLSLTVGGFVLLSLAALAVAILSLSAQQGVFQQRYTLTAYFDNVQGLVPGASVRLAGTGVGQVKRVDLATRPSGEPAVEVRLEIDEGVQERIRGDSLAQITTVGLLGDQIVEISIGSPDAPMLEDGALLATANPFDLNVMISKGGAALEAIQSLAANLDEALEGFQAAGGGTKLADSVAGLGSIIQEVQTGDGMLHSLVYEPYQGSAISSLEGSLASMERILREVERGEGLLHSLVFDSPGDQGVMMQFVQAGANLNSILAKVDSGEGTLGLLLNDPTLYEEVKLLVGGARRSTLVRSMIDLVTPNDE